MNRIFLALVLFITCGTNAYTQEIFVQPAGTVIEGGRHYLKMQVWNCSDDDIEVPFANLPWGQYTLGLVLYPAGKLAGEPLRERIPIGDSPSTKIKIKAKGRVDGKIDLDYRFKDISRYKNSGSLLVFWAYDTSLITGGKPLFAGGMIPLDGVTLLKGNKTGCN